MRADGAMANLFLRLCVAGSIAVVTTLFSGCASSQRDVVHETKAEFVRHVNCSEVPKMQEWADRARRIGNEFYPKVCALLATNDSKPPKQFDIFFKKHLGKGHSGEAGITEIYINAEWMPQFRDDSTAFDQLIVHEMTHLAQNYQRRMLGGLFYWNSEAPSCWQEGIADYACFRLGLTNGISCPECNVIYSHYGNGYSCAGAFLLFLEANYNTNLVRELNYALRHSSYSDDFFLKATGQSLPDLWTVFQKTPAFTPVATRAMELRRELGYKNDKPPKDFDARFKAYLDQHASESEKSFLKFANVNGESVKDSHTQIALYLYVTQPGGTAELFAMTLAKDHLLPGFKKDEHGNLSAFVTTTELNATRFPVSRTFTATKKGDASTYHYTVKRETADSQWQLVKAWRVSPDGKSTEQFQISKANVKSND